MVLAVDVKGTETAVGIRTYRSSYAYRNKESKQDVWSSIVSVITLSLYVGWLHILLGLFVASFFSRLALLILAALFGTVLLPARPLLWREFNQGWVFSTWRDYFSFSYLVEEILDKNKRYVFAEYPHGVFPMGPLLAGSLCQVLFPDFKIYSVAATSLFSVPRHFISWMGSVPATKSNFKSVLKKGSVAVIAGGIAEMYMCSTVQENVLLKSRKGFVEIAVEEGVDGGVIPVFHFGNSQILDLWPQSASKLSRRMRAALGFLCGRMGLPLPRKVPIFMVLGHPVLVNQKARQDPGFKAEVDRVHALVVSELQGLYDRHKAEYGWLDRPLVMH